MIVVKMMTHVLLSNYLDHILVVSSVSCYVKLKPNILLQNTETLLLHANLVPYTPHAEPRGLLWFQT